MSDLKQPGQRPYEAYYRAIGGWATGRHWEMVSPDEQRAWCEVYASLVPAEPEQVGKAQGWIPVSERLPEEGEPCVVLAEHWSGHGCPPEIAEREGKPTQLVWRRFCADETDDEVSLYIEDKVTHWLPLPAPPTKDPTNG